MAKKSAIEKNLKRMRMVKQYANRRDALKAIINDVDNQSEDVRFNAVLKLASLPRNSSPTRYRLRCAITGRPRGNYRKFGLCRIKVRELASKGQIPGMVKASW